MGVDSFAFIAFFIVSLILYYFSSEKSRKYILILASLLFAATYDVRSVLFLAGVSAIIWYAALKIKRIQEFGEDKSRARRVLIAANVLLIGTLVLIKYLLPSAIPLLFPAAVAKLFLPIGISYYTLQAVSYLTDVYWNRCEVEKNYGRLLLFISYFPHILQGPINRYGDFSSQVFEKKHNFSIKNLKYGVQLMLWGNFKVYVISRRISLHTLSAFHGQEEAFGLAAFLGLVLFGLQLYCDFSGGIDIIRGASECFSITLPDNFHQPFFASSLGDFWRRWHITMGTWIKDYVFFPFSMSRPVSKCKKKAKKYIASKWANRWAFAAANVVAFLIVGIWHGSGGNYALWGLYNGLILAFSELMTDAYRKGKQLCHINDKTASWHLFSVARTFLIVTIGWCTDCASTFMGSVRIILNMFHLEQTNLSVLEYGSLSSLLLLAVSVGALLAVDLLHEKKISIRKQIEKWPVTLQMLFWALFIQLIALLGGTASGKGFIYAYY